ncbi:MAG TPA: TIM barrel protein, partial [Gemmatimonadales bacterium]|nr:TIM barrel protein [Gemmatimonadales bacterium]
MPVTVTRREFLAGAALAATQTMALPMFVDAQEDPPFRISLAQWSFHKALKAGQLDHLDFAKVARTEFDIGAVEYVNTFFKDKATNRAYLAEMNLRAKDQGVFQHLIMIDVEGRLGDPDAALRQQAVENHKKWVEAARTLGCITIRVNAESEGTPAEQQKLCADGLRRLTEYGASRDINVIVENHEGLSTHGDWLVGVIKLVNHPRCGTLPDPGNFPGYDRYKGLEE